MQRPFDDIILTGTPYVHDDHRSASAGGTAAIDLMLHRIALLEGAALADRVAERLLYTGIRTLQRTSRITTAHRGPVGNAKVRRAIAYFERNLEEEIAMERVADHVAVSVRQLERLFRRYLGQSPRRYLNDMRLDRAMRLLIQTDMSVIEIGVATGFSSPSSFTRTFVQRFGLPPRRVRATQAAV